jgi:hypothetical protein
VYGQVDLVIGADLTKILRYTTHLHRIVLLQVFHLNFSLPVWRSAAKQTFPRNAGTGPLNYGPAQGLFVLD